MIPKFHPQNTLPFVVCMNKPCSKYAKSQGLGRIPCIRCGSVLKNIGNDEYFELHNETA